MTRGAQLEAVRREGKRIRTGTLEVRAAPSLLSHPRVGIVVPKYKQSGVERNRVKRRLRELSRTRVIPALAARPTDLVIRALPAAYAARFDGLAADLERVVETILRSQGTRERGNEGRSHRGGDAEAHSDTNDASGTS